MTHAEKKESANHTHGESWHYKLSRSMPIVLRDQDIKVDMRNMLKKTKGKHVKELRKTRQWQQQQININKEKVYKRNK